MSTTRDYTANDFRQRGLRRDRVLLALDIVRTRKEGTPHPLNAGLTKDGAFRIPEVLQFVRASSALMREIVERDAASTDYQREHLSGRVLRSADALVAAGERLAARYPWLAARLYEMAFQVERGSYRALRRAVVLNQERDALTALLWKLYYGKRTEIAARRTQAARRTAPGGVA